MHKFKYILQISNITCGLCVSKIYQILARFEQISEIRINVFTKQVQMRLQNKDKKLIKKIRKTLKMNGFILSNDQHYWKKSFILISILFSIQITFKFSLRSYFADLIISTIIQFIANKRIFKNEIIITDTVILGSYASFILGCLIDKENLFISSMIILSTFLGKYLLEEVGNKVAEKFQSEVTEEYLCDEKTVNVFEIQKEKILQICSSQHILFDGIIISGISLVDESNLTGEIELKRKTVNDLIYSGTFNKIGKIHVKVTNTANKTYLSNFLQKIVTHNEKKQSEIFYFCIFILTCTISIFFVSAIHSTISFAFQNSLSLLIISCPCALSISEPLTFLKSTHSLFKKGIIIRNSDVFQRIHKTKYFFFDKTGTLTNGIMEVKECKFFEKILIKFIPFLKENLKNDSDFSKIENCIPNDAKSNKQTSNVKILSFSINESRNIQNTLKPILDKNSNNLSKKNLNVEKIDILNTVKKNINNNSHFTENHTQNKFINMQDIIPKYFIFQFIIMLQKYSLHHISTAISNYCEKQLQVKNFSFIHNIILQETSVKIHRHSISGIFQINKTLFRLEIGNEAILKKNDQIIENEQAVHLTNARKFDLESSNKINCSIEEGNNKIVNSFEVYKTDTNYFYGIKQENDNFNSINEKNDTCLNIYIKMNNALICSFNLVDSLAPNIEKMIKYLRELKIEPIILTGDSLENTKRIAKKLKIDKFICGLTAECKERIINNYNKKSGTVMIGDGINDYLAINKATIGITLSDTFTEVGDISLFDNDFDNLIHFIEQSQKIRYKININFTFSIIYNFVVLILGLMCTFYNIEINSRASCISMLFSSCGVMLVSYYL